MAAGVTQLADLIVPSVFSTYTQLMTKEKSNLIKSGALTSDPRLDADLAGAGLTFNQPFFKDLENDEENVSNDDPNANSSPSKIGSGQEIQVRLSRNKSWSSMDLNKELIKQDPMDAIASRVAAYWTRRLQAAFVAVMKGMFANNATATDAYHTQNDMTYDVKGASFVDGVTNFTAENFIDATLTMGDSMEDLGMIMVHSVVYARMQKNNLIDFIPDSEGRVNIPTFLNRMVIVDDAMPVTSGVYESWLFGAGAVALGMGSPGTPTEVERKASAGNGGGQEILHNRVEWALHPVGHAYVGTSPNGGPSNAATTNNLANASSWRRVFTERKQIKIARLVTREM